MVWLDFSLQRMQAASIYHANHGYTPLVQINKQYTSLRASVSLRHCGRFFLLSVIFFLLSLTTAVSASASEASKILLSIDDQVIRCEAGPVGDTKLLREMLDQGASITVTWEFSIERVSRFWLNEKAGEVVVTRVVVSDLISRQWHLQDETAGIITDTGDANQAVRFLSYLNSFPLIDRSLLVGGEQYQISVKLHVRESDQPQAWWQRWVDFGKTVMVHRFTLPKKQYHLH